MPARIIPDIVALGTVHSISEKASVREAARLMSEKSIGCLVILGGSQLKGIITERDILFRVVAPGLDADSTPVSQVMTSRVTTVAPDETSDQALMRMQEGGFRHLPVAKDGQILGMVSVRDLYAASLGACEIELKECTTYIHGEPYGAAH
ncbi:MAG: CBS domain-containing protein [Alphaproteobacteria bacterium]|nr:CBS domain-containing protein [Alphaproteobacteria bacterium]